MKATVVYRKKDKGDVVVTMIGDPGLVEKLQVESDKVAKKEGYEKI